MQTCPTPSAPLHHVPMLPWLHYHQTYFCIVFLPQFLNCLRKPVLPKHGVVWSGWALGHTMSQLWLQPPLTAVSSGTGTCCLLWLCTAKSNTWVGTGAWQAAGQAHHAQGRPWQADTCPAASKATCCTPCWATGHLSTACSSRRLWDTFPALLLDNGQLPRLQVCSLLSPHSAEP